MSFYDYYIKNRGKYSEVTMDLMFYLFRCNGAKPCLVKKIRQKILDKMYGKIEEKEIKEIERKSPGGGLI